LCKYGSCPTTLFAHAMYSRRRSNVQSLGGEFAIAPMFEVLSASLTRHASLLFLAALMICNFFGYALGNDLSSVSSATMSATSLPNRDSSSATEVGGQSYTVSFSQAAAMAFSGPLQRSTSAATSSR